MYTIVANTLIEKKKSPNANRVQVQPGVKREQKRSHAFFAVGHEPIQLYLSFNILDS